MDLICATGDRTGFGISGSDTCRSIIAAFICSLLTVLLEKAMATHSIVLAWRIPGMGEPGGLLSMGSHRVGHDFSDLAAAAAATVLYSLV